MNFHLNVHAKLIFFSVLSSYKRHPEAPFVHCQTDWWLQQILFHNDNFFPLSDAVQINLGKFKSRDFYKLLNAKTHNEDHTGPLRWSQNLQNDLWIATPGVRFSSHWKESAKTLKEFQFKFIHRIIVTNKELLRFGIRPDDECPYCGDKDSIEHTFIECSFTKTCKGLFNGLTKQTYVRSFQPPRKSCLATFLAWDARIKKTFNYTTLAMRQYIYANNSKAISVHEFIDKLLAKYNLENIFQ